MGRPQSNRADYYPHLKEMRNHRKVKALRTKFGALQGYAFWCMMLEWLCGCDGIEWEYTELERELFAAELGVSAAEIKDMVDYCVKIELLFITNSGFIYSESLNEYLAPLFEKRQRERERSNTRKRRENGTFEVEKTQVSAAEIPLEKVSAAEMPQSKVEYSKVNKKKEEKESSGEAPVYPIQVLKDYEGIQKWISENASEVAKMKEPITIEQFISLKKKFSSEKISELLLKMHNWVPLLKKNKSAYLTLMNWSKNGFYKDDPESSKSSKPTKSFQEQDGERILEVVGRRI